MRKILLCAAILTGLAALNPSEGVADDMKMFGTVRAVDLTQRQISIRGDDGKEYSFNTNPATEIEIKHKYLFDTKGNLKDIKQGDWVKIEYEMTSPTFLVAEEIEVHREK